MPWLSLKVLEVTTLVRSLHSLALTSFVNMPYDFCMLTIALHPASFHHCSPKPYHEDFMRVSR